jgi:hypothetical protein
VETVSTAFHLPAPKDLRSVTGEARNYDGSATATSFQAAVGPDPTDEVDRLIEYCEVAL